MADGLLLLYVDRKVGDSRTAYAETTGPLCLEDGMELPPCVGLGSEICPKLCDGPV